MMCCLAQNWHQRRRLHFLGFGPGKRGGDVGISLFKNFHSKQYLRRRGVGVGGWHDAWMDRCLKLGGLSPRTVSLFLEPFPSVGGIAHRLLTTYPPQGGVPRPCANRYRGVVPNPPPPGPLNSNRS